MHRPHIEGACCLGGGVVVLDYIGGSSPRAIHRTQLFGCAVSCDGTAYVDGDKTGTSHETHSVSLHILRPYMHSIMRVKLDCRLSRAIYLIVCPASVTRGRIQTTTCFV